MTGIAILGMGVVGTGVYETLEGNAETIARRSFGPLEVKYILDLRDFPGAEFADKVIRDFGVVERDPDVKIVVETMGGATYAYDYTKRALAAGKNVVTSNKELVAAHGAELTALAEAHDVNYMFEASVGGGAPVIRPLVSCMGANVIEEIYGILNGTTNFILDRMERGGASLEEALSEAQALGYAERDPSADIEGLDPARKICILGSLACGCDIGVENVRAEGIAGLRREDVRHAAEVGYAVKLLARYIRLGEKKVSAFVAPHLIPKSCVLANVNGVFGGVTYIGNIVGEVDILAAGAGKLPTASAVAADIIDAARHLYKTRFRSVWSSERAECIPPEEIGGRFYVGSAGSARDAREVYGDIRLISEEGGAAFITPHLTPEERRAKTEEYRRRARVFSEMRVLERGVDEW